MKLFLHKKVNKSSFYIDFVNILNGVLQLSPREAEVFSYLLFYGDNGYENNVNHKAVRFNIINKLGISEANLSRYLNTIKTKGLIVRGESSKWVINDNIKPSFVDSQIDVSFILNIIEDEQTTDKTINGVYTKPVETRT